MICIYKHGQFGLSGNNISTKYELQFDVDTSISSVFHACFQHLHALNEWAWITDDKSMVKTHVKIHGFWLAGDYASDQLDVRFGNLC